MKLIKKKLDAGGIWLCTKYDKQGCSLKPGGWTITIPSKPKCFQTSGHISGYSEKKGGCTIFTNSDCTGKTEFVDQAGWKQFPISPVLSYTCQDML
jgi:hypothetical protein